MSCGGGPVWPAYLAAQNPKISTFSAPQMANSSATTTFGPKVTSSSCVREGAAGWLVLALVLEPRLHVAERESHVLAELVGPRCPAGQPPVIDRLHGTPRYSASSSTPIRAPAPASRRSCRTGARGEPSQPEATGTHGDRGAPGGTAHVALRWDNDGNACCSRRNVIGHRTPSSARGWVYVHLRKTSQEPCDFCPVPQGQTAPCRGQPRPQRV